MRSCFLALFAVSTALAGCGESLNLDAAVQHIEAGPPGAPVYTRTVPDSITGDNLPLKSFTGTSANCTAAQPCYIPEPNNNPNNPIDSYLYDVYERPFERGTGQAHYYPALDIVSANTGITQSWFYYRLNLFSIADGTTPGATNSLPYFYSVEVNFDGDDRGDAIIQIDQPSMNVGTNWGSRGLLVKVDQTGNPLGGPRPILPDGAGNGGGYEHAMFDGTTTPPTNSAPNQPGGTTAVQARVINNTVEIAIYRPFFEALTSDPVTAAAFRPYATFTTLGQNSLYVQDDKTRKTLGSPYPWLTLAGAPTKNGQTICPDASGNGKGDDGLTTAQINALESGTDTVTANFNPCYAQGADIYRFDNAGTVESLADKNGLSFDVDLSLDKSDSPDPATINVPMIYTLTVTNNRPALVTNITITDPLPLNLTFVSAPAGCFYTSVNRTVTCFIASLAANSSTARTITVIPTALGTFTNTATVTSDGDEQTPANNTDTETTTVTALCGNGTPDAGEECDDGNTVDGDGCDTNCRSSRCGNGIVAGTEQCDDGNTNNADGCEANCTLPVCGNNITDPNEQCDDGNSIDGDLCESCKFPGCGNGVVSGTEQCDDGNNTNGDGCQSNCTRVGCGNGIPEAGEACDDGNTTDGDGCDNNCTATGCGNGIVTGSETCDDSGESATCDANCTAAQCGDGTVNATAGETCDTSGESASCDANCTAAQCGDGTVNATAGETCDTSGESASCDANCTAAQCGDGTINATAGETCDDSGESTTCDANCTAAQCGDGTVNATAGETCDDSGESATCDANCTAAQCGDGTVNATAGEACDDAGPSATCNGNCTATRCGDGIVNGAAGETCDDSGESATCDANCTAAQCGDGTVNATAGETCDTSGESASCDANCTAAQCGDGTVNATAGETCDTS
ncbi:MAG TPA: DUF4215 domain-containing protein, partial [Kofleriaceae bacterium]|nr:DUF4215 domain-containing protein [Kofleriaceae bacterium]